MAGAFPWAKTPAPSAVAADAKAAEKKDDAATKTAESKEAASKEKDEKAVAKSDPPDPKAKPADDAKPEIAAAKTDAKPAEEKVAAAKPKAEATGQTIHDAETLALIDEELKAAAPAERDILFAEWKSLDSAMVQQVIRIRRMVRELDSTSPSAATAATTAPALPGTTSPWGIHANAATPPANVDDGQPIAIASAAAAQAAALNAAALPEIQPAGHNAAASPANLEATAAYGRAMTVASAEGATAGANTPPAATAPTPSATETSSAWNGQVQQLIVAAESRANQARAGFLDRDPQAPPADEVTRRLYVESQVHVRLLYLMAGDQARAMQAIPGLDAADQQFWQQVLWGVSSYFDDAAMPNRADRMTQTVEQLRTAVTRLQGEANLQLRNVAFCRKITSFGNFERFDRDEYSPGQRVLLYGEVLNFKSVPQPTDGFYKTQLRSTVEILPAGQSQAVTKIEFDPTIDLCRSYRQDYFHSYELKIPAELNVGAYVLKLSVEDAQSGKLATYTLNFTVK